MTDTQVLIAGAGPTGLALALWLAKSGVRVRIADKAAAPGTTSRALVVHARTLEFYRQLGIADAAIAGGVKFTAINLWVSGRQVGHVPIGDLGVGMSPYPYLLVFPQDQHEQTLVEQLEHVGVRVERETELVSFEASTEGIKAHLRKAGHTEEVCRAAFLAGCDGAHSIVREELGVGFPGGTYTGPFYIADIDAAGPVVNGELHVALDDADLLAVFPMKGEGRVRLVGQMSQEQGAANEPRWDDVSKRLLQRLNIEVKQVGWFSTYHVHHRVAGKFRDGRVFLLGDAAHIHSPVGGQGMNTGIGDAVNLAWKLAAALQGRIEPALLDTYESERIAFARKLVATTDRGFQFVTARGPLATRVRLNVVPTLLPKLFRLDAVRRFMFQTISQIAIKYPDSPLSVGSASHVRGGDRLPWVSFDDLSSEEARDNFAYLGSLDWQVHCYGEAPAAIHAECEARSLSLHVFPWRSSTERAGLQRGAAYLIRPDGHVGLADPGASAAKLAQYLDQHGIRPCKPRQHVTR